MKARLARHFRGTISDLTANAAGDASACDLAAMARAALNYLRRSPDPARGYECKFSLGPLGIPSHCPEWVPANQYGYDPISLGDTDARMAMQYAHMRAMAGDSSPEAAEEGVIARVLGYLRDDNCAWINPAAYIGQPIDGLWIGTWTTGKCLYILSELWQATGDQAARQRARKIFEALRDLAQWDGDKAWYMGIAPIRDGEWLMDGWCQSHGRNYPFIVEPLVRYWECTGDNEALDLARAFTEGFLGHSQPDMREQRIDNETGAFEGHVHLHTHAAWGVAHLGALLAEPRYLEWARNIHDFVLANGTDYGWYPEFIPQKSYCTEICVVGDMVSIAAWLARGGLPQYWDHVERAVNNELRRSQFSLTPAFMALFAKLHADKSPAVVDEAVAALRQIEGGFVAQATFDDWVGYPSDHMGQAGIGRNGIHMMGCCPPEGMRGLYEAWCGTVEEADGDVHVNLPYHREHPAAIIAGDMPGAGRLQVEARKAGAYFLRPPAWADREQVRLTCNDAPLPLEWSGPAGAYVAAKSVHLGDNLDLTWDVPLFTQTMVATSIPDRAEEVSVTWLGNTVRSVNPAGQHLPMFTESAG